MINTDPNNENYAEHKRGTNAGMGCYTHFHKWLWHAAMDG
jgi:hypothetical protein